MIARLLVFRARLVSINFFPSFLLFSPFKGSLILANAAKPPFLLVYMAKTKLSGSLLLLGTRDCET
jgi:hypothetical protein